jgi:hypothetical protein
MPVIKTMPPQNKTFRPAAPRRFRLPFISKEPNQSIGFYLQTIHYFLSVFRL